MYSHCDVDFMLVNSQRVLLNANNVEGDNGFGHQVVVVVTGSGHFSALPADEVVSGGLSIYTCCPGLHFWMIADFCVVTLIYWACTVCSLVLSCDCNAYIRLRSFVCEAFCCVSRFASVETVDGLLDADYLDERLVNIELKGMVIANFCLSLL